MNQTNFSPIEILLVEDNPGDLRLIIEVLKDSKLSNEIYVAMDGEQAVQMLHKEGKYSEMPRPDLILLDLNLPKKDGRELLAEIKQDDQLKIIPVIILTSSTEEEDVRKYASSYIIKPLDPDEFIKEVRKIREFWFSVVKAIEIKE
jgi:two-component system, chemotaxis family, response regulator Rcp1